MWRDVLAAEWAALAIFVNIRATLRTLGELRLAVVIDLIRVRIFPVIPLIVVVVGVIALVHGDDGFYRTA